MGFLPTLDVAPRPVAFRLRCRCCLAAPLERGRAECATPERRSWEGNARSGSPWACSLPHAVLRLSGVGGPFMPACGQRSSRCKIPNRDSRLALGAGPDRVERRRWNAIYARETVPVSPSTSGISPSRTTLASPAILTTAGNPHFCPERFA